MADAARDISLSTPLEASGLVTPLQASKLAGLGLTNIGRLLAHLPMRHERLEAESAIEKLVPGTLGSARGEVTAVRPVRGRSPRLEAVLVDDTGRLDLVWFNGLYLMERVRPGAFLRVHGKVQARGHAVQMINPRLEAMEGSKADADPTQSRLRPVYPASEDINSAAIEKIMGKVLPRALALLEDHLPETFRTQRDMPSLRDAYRMQHQPADELDVKRSRRRLAFDELLLLQLGVALKRAQLREQCKAPALPCPPEVDARIRARIPFSLTPGQEKVIEDVRADLASSTPTNRLIQGDVGSGKTVIALYAMLLAVANAAQGAMMAATEILAEQHYASMTRMLEGSRVRVALLTGSTPQRERDALRTALQQGDVDIIVGTHALLTEDVRFARLGVAIIDEQHRFGVSQRAGLRAKAGEADVPGLVPHQLVMTATPIPRSLAMTLFGDLDISVVEGMPPGRTPVVTRVVSSHHRPIAYDELRARIARGEQGFVVAPAIEPGLVPAPSGGAASTPLVDVRTLQRALEDTYAPGARIAVLHGQLARDTRDAVMERFRQGIIDVVVATTVIEVGIDVPNATIIIVEQADRFGLAQLHQLRGRVGRGDKPGACFLIADPSTGDGDARLGVMERTHDGFVLAEKDLEIRGMGELFGLRQSGLPPFRVADPLRDRDLLVLARQDAAAWIQRSPALDQPEEALLRRRLMKSHGKFLGLGDVG